MIFHAASDRLRHSLLELLMALADVDDLQDVVVGRQVQRSHVQLRVVGEELLRQTTHLRRTRRGSVRSDERGAVGRHDAPGNHTTPAKKKKLPLPVTASAGKREVTVTNVSRA